MILFWIPVQVLCHCLRFHHLIKYQIGHWFLWEPKSEIYDTTNDLDTTENDLDVKKCVGNATDGAANNMQGQFNGFSAWLEKMSPNQVRIWCYAHILNLVVIESTKSPLNAAALFVTLNDVAIFFKELYKRMNTWVDIIDTNDKRRLQAIGNTWWWSREKSLTHIFGDEGLYLEVILALNTIENLNEFIPGAKLKAFNLKKSFLSYSTILTAFTYVRI